MVTPNDCVRTTVYENTIRKRDFWNYCTHSITLQHTRYPKNYNADSTTLLLNLLLNPGDRAVSKSKVEACVSHIIFWTTVYPLKINSDKTKFLICPSHFSSGQAWSNSIQVDNDIFLLSQSVKNIDVLFDRTLSMQDQVSDVCKSCFDHLRNTSNMRRGFFLKYGNINSFFHYC